MTSGDDSCLVAHHSTDQTSALTRRRDYSLTCSTCGERQADDGLVLSCRSPHEAALLRTEYPDRGFLVDDQAGGIFRYRRWLPVIRDVTSSARTVVFQGKHLGRALGLRHLWVAFNGYWPERGALCETGSFKDLEASAVLGRLPWQAPVLVVASTGNTGAAFASACSQNLVPCLIVIPERGLGRMRLRASAGRQVRIIVLADAEYADAIAFAEAASRLPGFHAEGGISNVGRRDGLATVAYSAFETMGRMPDYYFQAVGSATGAIAFLEGAQRLKAAPVSGPIPRLMLCQNAPFAPIYDAWTSGASADTLAAGGPPDSMTMRADELANARPPFFVPGGIRDALIQSQGDVLTADNRSVDAAMTAFAELESIDIEPAAATAVACLRDAALSGRIPSDATILLNITGGGRRRLERESSPVMIDPMLHFSRDDAKTGRALNEVAELSLN